MKQTLDIKKGSGSSTGSLTFSASALTHVLTDYTLVTLPATPGYVYKVFVDAWYIPTASATTGSEFVKAYIRGYSGPTSELSNSAIGVNTTHAAQLLGVSNGQSTDNALSNQQAGNLHHPIPVEGIEYAPGESVIISIDTKTQAASSPAAATYTFRYRYIGKAILTGTF